MTNAEARKWTAYIRGVAGSQGKQITGDQLQDVLLEMLEVEKRDGRLYVARVRGIILDTLKIRPKERLPIPKPLDDTEDVDVDRIAFDPMLNEVTQEDIDDLLQHLTDREGELIGLLFQGFTQADISRKWGVNQATISRMYARIVHKVRPKFRY